MYPPYPPPPQPPASSSRWVVVLVVILGALVTMIVVGVRVLPRVLRALEQKPGDRCTAGAYRCLSKTEALRCVDGRFQAFPCLGPRGCRPEAIPSPTDNACDLSGNAEGSVCYSPKGDTEGQCSSDKAWLFICKDGKLSRTHCRSSEGCHTQGDRVSCDITVAESGDACDVQASACSVSGNEMLQCHDGKWSPKVPCKGPNHCRVKPRDPSSAPSDAGTVTLQCDTLGDPGDACALDPDIGLCSSAHDAILKCVDGKLASFRYCRGPKGCTQTADSLSCDTDVGRVGDPCTGEGSTCDEKHKHRLKCKKGQLAVELSCKCSVAGDIVRCK